MRKGEEARLQRRRADCLAVKGEEEEKEEEEKEEEEMRKSPCKEGKWAAKTDKLKSTLRSAALKLALSPLLDMARRGGDWLGEVEVEDGGGQRGQRGVGKRKRKRECKRRNR